MGGAITPGGLCSNCKHAAVCTYPRDPARRILRCDEYECSKPAGAASVTQQKPAASRPESDPTARAHDSHRLLGLCSNCDNRETCVLPKPEGGVWRCEEYR